MADAPKAARQGTSRLSDTPPYLWAAAAGCAVLALYVLTLAPTTQFWDTSRWAGPLPV